LSEATMSIKSNSFIESTSNDH